MLFGVLSAFGNEDETPLSCMIQVTLMEGPLVVDGDLGVTLEDVRQRGEGIGSYSDDVRVVAGECSVGGASSEKSTSFVVPSSN